MGRRASQRGGAAARATAAAPAAAGGERAAADPPAGPTRHERALFGFAAVALVMACRYQPLFLFFPVHAFHLGLLFLAAGHCAAAPAGPRALLPRLLAEARSWLGLFYAANLGFALLTLLLARAGLDPGGPAPSFASADSALASLQAFLLAPFGFGEAYALFQPGWLLVQLFLASALFQVLALARSRLVLAGAALLSAGAAAALLGDGGSGPGLPLLAGRTAFALAFFLGGNLLRSADETARRRLVSPAATVACFLAADALGAGFGGLAYHLERGSLGDRSGLVSLASTAALALLVWQLAHHAARIAGERSALLAIGRSWRAVLVWQSCAFFATNCALLALGFLQPGQLSVAFSFNLNKTWLFYLVPALALPVLGRRAAASLAKRPVPA